MSETKTVYDPASDHIIPFQDPSFEEKSLPFLPTSTIYNADSQIRSLLDIAVINEDPITAGLSAGFLLLHKDLDRIATALEMRNRADTADRPLSRRLRAVQGGAKP